MYASNVEVWGEQNYEFTHGRKPRGRAVWLFERRNGTALEWSTVRFQYSGTYTEARKAAPQMGSGLGQQYREGDVMKRYRMDTDTAEHFYVWLEQAVPEDEQHDVEQAIHVLLAKYPDLVQTHSWPEMRTLAEAG